MLPFMVALAIHSRESLGKTSIMTACFGATAPEAKVALDCILLSPVIGSGQHNCLLIMKFPFRFPRSPFVLLVG